MVIALTFNFNHKLDQKNMLPVVQSLQVKCSFHSSYKEIYNQESLNVSKGAVTEFGNSNQFQLYLCLEYFYLAVCLIKLSEIGINCGLYNYIPSKK